MWSEVQDTLVESLRRDPGVAELVGPLEAEVSIGRLTPAAAARRLLDVFRA